MADYRKRQNHLSYKKHIRQVQGKPCEFCAFSEDMDQVLTATSHFWVVKNLFPYDMWDNNDVKDHLMLVPKRHVEGISKFDEKEIKDFHKTISVYEKRGYSIYSRAPSNITKSVPHQHTHLISISKKPKRFVLYTKKPYMLFTK